MAITKASLQTKIETELTSQGFDLTDPYSYASKMADAIATAVISEITTNAVVNTVVTGTCPTGAVTGTGVGTVS